MKKALESWMSEDFEKLGAETMRKCWDVRQAASICAPTLEAYGLRLKPLLKELQSAEATLKHQASALHSILYERLIPASDAHMLAHSRRLKIVALFTVLTALGCLVGNASTFYLMGAGPLLAIAGAFGMTAIPLGIGHLAYERLIAASRGLQALVVLVVVVLFAAGIIIVGQGRREMIDRSITTPTVSSYVDGEGSENNQPIEQPKSDPSSGDKIRRTLGEGIFLIVLAAELGLAYLVGWFIELYSDPYNTAWRRLQHIRRELSELESRIAELVHAPEVAKKCCLAGILTAEAERPRRHPPYHQALTLLLAIAFFFALPLHAQTVEHYEGILIDTSASISRGGRTNELFQQYLIAARRTLLSEAPNSRVWVWSISANSFGGAHEILKGWTPDARGVFTDDLNRARIQLASTFERKSATLAPLATSTDIFGGLWHLKALFESSQTLHAARVSRSIVIFSDMMNETRAFPMPELLELGPEQMLERARADGLIVPLSGYRVYVRGASNEGLNPKSWNIVKTFWIGYFQRTGAELESYSVDCSVEP